MIAKPAPTTLPIHPLLKERWSGRAYDGSRSLSPEDLAVLAEATRWTPSCMNLQPWRFIPAIRGETPIWDQVLEALAPSNQVWAKEAPLLVTVAADTLFADGKPNRWARYDTGAAAMALALQATNLGLMAHQMGGIVADQLKTVLDLPESFEVMTVIAVGYQLSREQVPESLKERELGERTRLPLEQTWLSRS